MRAGDTDGETIVPVIIHGDAAFAGQGMVAETVNLSQLNGYCTGGTIHVIVNNQIGYTTTPSEARSTLYCSDVAKMIQVPLAPLSLKLPAETNLAYGYQIQAVFDHYMSKRFGRVSGYKMAYASKASQEKWGISEPVSGTFFAQQKVASGGSVPLDSFMGFHIETEIAFTLKKGIYQQIQTVKQLMPYLKSVHVGLDVPDLRYETSKGKLTAIDVVAMSCGKSSMHPLI